MNADTSYLIASYSTDRRAFACVNRTWRAGFSNDDRIWAGCLFGDYQLKDKIGPVKIAREDTGDLYDIRTLDSFRDAWLAWRVMEYELEQYNEGRIKFADIWVRAIRMWSTIRNTLRELKLLDSLQLRPGSWSVYRKTQKMKCFKSNPRLLEAVRAIWGQHDGQGTGEGTFVGLFGMTKFYDQTRSIILLPISAVYDATNPVVEAYPNGFCFGNDLRMTQMVMYNNNAITYLNGGSSSQCPTMPDALLCFFEAYAKDLSMYKRTHVLLGRPPSTVRVLSSFPQTGPRTAVSITQNIRVKGAYVLYPGVEQPDGSLLFVYEFQMDLIDQSHPDYVPEETRAWKSKAVLLSRHWTIKDPRKPSPEIVEGQGVVGFNPCFDSRNKMHRETIDSTTWLPNPFAYRSCTYAHPGTSMEGYLTFVPENDDDSVSINRSFRVRVARLTFQRPEYPF